MVINAKIKIHCIFEGVLTENRSKEFLKKPSNDTFLSILQGCASRGPGKIRFSRKSSLKIAKISKIALLNDPKKFFQNQNLKCSESFNSQSYLVKIDFPAPFSNSPYYKGVRGQT